MIREDIVQEARTWLGTPFIHQGMVKGAGVGCGTLLIAVYGGIGLPVPDPKTLGYFPRDWHLHTREERYLNILLGFAHPVEVPEPGDMVLFQIGRIFAHSGIVVKWPTEIIHVMWGSSVEIADASKQPLDRKKTMFLSPL